MKLIKPLQRSIFGKDDVVDHDVRGSYLIVVLGNKGYGYKPLKVCLGHQLYLKDILKYEEEGWKEISVAAVGPVELVAA